MASWHRAAAPYRPLAMDLVGHDWGCLLVQRVASLRPDLVRSWAGGDGPIDREYVWHDLAQQWQTPGAGEAIMADMTGTALAEGLAATMPPDDARAMAAHVDDVMKDCIPPPVPFRGAAGALERFWRLT
jgi:pimeloyl-ACP methyl ester carboxylesterase